jgi:hypothetical protein
MSERTTKTVTGTFTLVFHGDYLDRDEVFSYFEGWVDQALEDRDDLRGWNFTALSVVEVTGDPKGFDA